MRLINRVFAVILSLALVVGAVLLIIEVIAEFTNNAPIVVDWVHALRWAGRTTWTSGSLRVISIAVTTLGVILLVAELKPPRVTRFRVADSDSEAPVDSAYTRNGVAGAVRAAVVDVDGIRSAAVAVNRRRVSVVAETRAHDTESARQLQAPATEAAQQRLDQLNLASAPKVKLTTTARKR